MTSIVLIAVVATLVWVLFTTLWLWRNQERVVFQPPGVATEVPEGVARVPFHASDGALLFAFVVRPDADQRDPQPIGSQRTDAVVLAFHGNADLAAWFVPWARELAARTGSVVVLPEYRGYGGIAGTPSYETAAADAVGAVTFVREQLRPEALALFGHSLGTAIASDVAAFMSNAGHPAGALILQSPFTSAREMAARMLVPPIPWLWRRITRVHYDTVTIVSGLECPVWVAHGNRDVVIPVRMGRQVFAASRAGGELLVVDGAGHNDVPDVGGDRYWAWIGRAVASARSRVSARR